MPATMPTIERQESPALKRSSEREPGWKRRVAEGAAVGIGSASAYEAIKALLAGTLISL
ncbi:hypothetical protein HYW84_03960 [Candidatus Peregrinibacteria bacterium]|nr:hypothetical protein [Candidatus Peregrinibacteria bacterium]